MIVVHDKATLIYGKDWPYCRRFLVSGYPTKEILKLKNTEENTIAIGGGSVIDTGKILSKNPDRKSVV